MGEQTGHVLTVAALERALDEDHLVAVYQPCFDLRTGALVAVEALARLRDPATGELLAPMRFIPTAEDSGLVTRLDLMMIEQAFRQTARWRRTTAGKDLCVAINLSPADLDEPRIAERISGLARAAGLPIEAVIVELTETVLAETGRGHDKALAGIADLGCNLTLDDFGTGNASFGYLQRFDVDGLKIDRSFVQALGEGGARERVAESLIRFCLSLDVHVVAEGIEDRAQVEAVRRLGCHFGQGFYLARPMTAEQLDVALHDDRLVLPGMHGESVPASAPPPTELTRRPRSRTSLLAAVVVLLLACLAALTTVTERHAEESLKEAARDRLVTIDSLAAGQVDKNVALIRVAVAESIGRPGVRRAIQGRDLEALDAELVRIMATPSEIFSASVYDAAGTMLAVEPATPGVVGENFAFREWYQGARDTEGPYVSTAFRLRTPEQPWAIATSAAVRDGAGRPVGYVVATYVLAGLQAELSTALSHHGVSATLVDGRDALLATPDGRKLGSRTEDPRLLADAAASGQDGDVQWAVERVPSIDGWLLVEQSSSEAVGAYPASGRLMTGLVVLVAAGAIVLVLLWARGDRRRRRLEAELAAAHDWLSTVLASTPMPLVVCDGAGTIQTTNAAMAELLGTTVAVLEGADLRTWLPLDSQPRSDSGAVTTSVVTADGDVRVVEVRTQLLGNPQGQPMQLHTLFDVTPHREEHDRLRALGRADPLTGVGNRRALREALNAAVADATTAHAVVMMDLDHFKAVNDTLGHSVGDELLSDVAATLVDTVRPGDTVTRIGGDEFVTVVRLADEGHADAVAARLHAAVKALLDVHAAARSVGVGVSTGTAVVGIDGVVPDDLLFVADQRMYAAKRSARPRSTT